MPKRPAPYFRKRLCVALAYMCVAAGFVVYFNRVETQVASQTRRPARYSQFPHDIKAHALECSSCHKFPTSNWNKVRTGDAAFPDVTEYPQHESCLNCHRRQFFSGAKPTICSICHVNPSPRDSRRHPFPNPRDLFDASKKGKTAESDFVIFFPHDKHIEIVTARAAPRIFINAAFTRAQAEESCGVCHQTYKPQGDSPDEFFTKPPAKLGDGYWLKKGTFKTKPIDHARCFTCHSADSGLMPEPANCAVCHKIKPVQPPADIDLKTAAQMAGGDKIVMDSWRRRDSTGKFRHEFAVHAELSCSTCHTVAEMNTTLPATKRVKIASCSMCHATSTAEEGGALNIEIAERAKNAAFRCTKCHISFGGLPIPESHSKALAEATGQ